MTAKVKTKKEIYEEILSYAKKKGRISYDEINRMLPPLYSDPDTVDELIMLLVDSGVEVYEEAIGIRRRKKKK